VTVMLTAKQMDDLISEWRLLSRQKKSALLADFIEQYGEHAEWEEWIKYLQERSELDKFEWTRPLIRRSSS
jgi:hypothetical protein